MNGVVSWRQAGTGIRQVQQVTRGGASVVVDCLARGVIVADVQAVYQTTTAANWRISSYREWIDAVIRPNFESLVSDTITCTYFHRCDNIKDFLAHVSPK